MEFCEGRRGLSEMKRILLNTTNVRMFVLAIHFTVEGSLKQLQLYW